ncbi:NADPH-dependent FMN reductase [Antrihabitans stalactiti]|uniref:NAD(P)H-dependent oxidoreductase n=1 Tax=Antrihabitans stalactiti TaxID=2584121 RepID=A0A848KAE9_9NOCA|nr:NAD(P)H-dependent oxidoreductase [Antrihabitans stalactiti]NMN95309.1 NAD(P)H-dependent oxidoreductase [Antrihabitans stalactiti]
MNAGESVRIAVIIGSTRHGRFGPTITQWFVGRAQRRRDLDIDVIDLATVALPDVLVDDDEAQPESVQLLATRLAAADAFVIVTPEYNGSFPASVKTAIDWYTDEWAAKPVTFVTYGRESGGANAAAALRQVFGELNAVVIRRAVLLPCYWDQFAADGTWPKPNSCLDQTVTAMLDQLTWWAHALNTARTEQPCPN